jgi:hypothetical protein
VVSLLQLVAQVFVRLEQVRKLDFGVLGEELLAQCDLFQLEL